MGVRSGKDFRTGEAGRRAEFLFDSKNRIVLGKPLAAPRRTKFHQGSTNRDGNVGDRVIDGSARPPGTDH